MGKVVFNISVSLDGFVAGPNDGPENGLGDGGERLHEWLFGGDQDIQVPGAPPMKLSAQSASLFREALENGGASIWGRRTFEIAQAWGGHPPFAPSYILTHHPPQEWIYEGSPFIFVTGGIESAVRQAKQSAGEKDVVLSTASVLQQALNAGQVDEITLNLVPVLLGGGVRLFENLRKPLDLEIQRVLPAPGVTHIQYRVRKG